jgi:hypothetical protein
MAHLSSIKCGLGISAWIGVEEGMGERGGSVPASPCCRRRHRRASGMPAPSLGLGLGELYPQPEEPPLAPSVEPDLGGRRESRVGDGENGTSDFSSLDWRRSSCRR